jgi:prepilin-type processing-associated H-X9-DG protein
MYKILGVDQKEYGPVNDAQVREWIAQGRANAQTKVLPDGATDWKPLAEFPDFAEALKAAAPPPTPRPMPSIAVPVAAAVSPKTSGLAIASLVLGVLGLFTCGATALVGLVLGIVAIVQIEKSKGQVGGKGLALAGTITSGAFLLLVPAMMAAMLLPALAKAKQRATMISCMSNVKQLNVGLMMYADANQDKLPSGAAWCDSVQQYTSAGTTEVFLCKEGKPGARSHYAFNAKLGGISTKDISAPAQTVMIFETDGGWNVSGGKELLPAKPRHNNVYIIGFADGHCEAVRPERLGRLRWDP